MGLDTKLPFLLNSRAGLSVDDPVFGDHFTPAVFLLTSANVFDQCSLWWQQMGLKPCKYALIRLTSEK